ncbi:MAG TPA: hypothetical protein VNV37_00205 [Solirubrobacteraceae bacterium]|nr:hypothetical protein [Solirubrobacteraceae bacterium]
MYSPPPAAPRAPTAPPLAGAQASEGAATTGGDASASAPPSSGDPLVENGLGSPLCRAPAPLPASARRNCETSGFEAAGAPTGDYGLDVHIDTGLLGVTSQTLLQDYVIAPVWTGVVWVVQALIVTLEWCFTLDLLDSAVLDGLERSLHATQTAFTGPWLTAALALAAIAAAYNGLVRRRVAETLGQVALMLVMMAGGLWVIADPSGTVGALGRWVDEASAGTLGAVVQGSPGDPSRTLAQSLGGLFGAVVGAPWCYLEFGNVDWCENPRRLEGRLRTAALALIASTGPEPPVCEGEPTSELCAIAKQGSGPHVPPRSLSATLIRRARTNGELFLALPANEPARNSIDEPGSLLRALCGGAENATTCRGPSAAEAEFRTQGGTTPRLGGLLLIAIGAAGMVMLLGFIALHLLGAEILSLLYLLLAPAAVIAPALGDGGRAAFRSWGTRLLGAVCSKLIFSFLLGVVLLMTRTLIGIEALGWWTRWLLVAALWWGTYRQRHQVLGLIAGEHRGAGERHPSLIQRFKQQLEGPRTVWRGTRWAYNKLSRPAPSVERRQALERIGHERAQAAADAQVARLLECDHATAGERAASAADVQSELSAKRAQLQRVRGERAKAVAAGDTRRAARLNARATRIEGEVEGGQRALNEARHAAAEGERAQRRGGGRPYTAEQQRERAEWLDAQAALPPARGGGIPRAGVSGGGASGAPGALGGGALGDAAAMGARRDYGGVAGLVGHSRAQYDALAPRAQREARLEIDRELALRRELSGAASSVAAAGERASKRGDRRRAGRNFDRALEQRLRDGGHTPPRSHDRPPRRDRPRDTPPHPPRRPGNGNGAGAAGGVLGGPPGGVSGGPGDGTDTIGGGFDSPVMRDAYEVMRRRKRQLGG